METAHIKISKRLLEISRLLPKGAKFVDVGSDHAYLPCYVCLQDEKASAIAGEVNVGPYNSAVENVKKYGLEKRISVRLGDGLEVVKPEDHYKQLVIAGMGGGLITQILEEGKDKLSPMEKLILQPNINSRKVRVWLKQYGFILVHERILEENGHIYEILVAERTGKDPYEESIIEKQLLFGPYLLLEKPQLFQTKWLNEGKKLAKVIEQMKQATNPDYKKIGQFEKELEWIKEVLER